MNYPQSIKHRALNNPRLGIKSSLPNPRKVLALLYLIYLCCGKKASINYLVTNPSDKNKATLDGELGASIINFLGKDEDFLDELLSNPLVASQIEALQVALQLFFRLAKINFTTNTQSERTGGIRNPKTIEFSTNIDVLDLFLGQFDESQKIEFLLCWLNDEDDDVISPLIKKLLVTFVEPTIFRITETNDKFLDFDLFGMYESFLKKGMNGIDYKGEDEPKGSARVLGSYIRNGLHPYINQHGGMAEVNRELIDEFKEYAKRVDTSLSIAPKLDDYPFDSDSAIESKPELMPISGPRQVIYFGAPGTGKSRAVNNIVKERAPKNNIRTTFHPDSDYSSFVGCYKPTMRDGKIEYAFTAQAFIKAYIGAWSDISKPYFLVIEEINRGNCAQIFGDIFQLLDRENSGESSYGIKPDSDLQNYIAERLESISEIPVEIASGEEMRLPSNFFIYATMNTSDQSLFPIDSAFKRRWDWRYTAIKPSNTDHSINVKGVRYNWTSFIREVNKKILDLTKSEDKQLGYWFIKPDEDGNIDWELFVSKALFYLWNDVIKDYATLEKADSPFGRNYAFTTFFDENGKPIADRVIAFLDALKVEKLIDTSDNTPEGISEEENEESEEDDATSLGKDRTKYSINGEGRFGKNILATELVRKYIETHPDATAFDVVKAFRGLGNLVSHFVELQEEFDQREDQNPRVKTVSCKNENIYVSTNGWGGNDKMRELIDGVHSKDWGLTISEIPNG